MTSDSESNDETSNWKFSFQNYSMNNEGPLNTAIEKIIEMGVSTTQSSGGEEFLHLDKIRLSDLTSDDD
jgi:hypothetical protein